MIDFKHHNEILGEALKVNKKLLESSQKSLNEMESKILQNKDKFTPEQLQAFEDAKKEAEKMRNELNKM